MSSTTRWAAFAAMLILSTGCRASIDVRTMAAPDASFANLHTFRLLPDPARRDGLPVTGADDPMVANSIANRAIRERIIKTFQDRGYILDNRAPDFAVAFYATAREKLDIATWDYGYPLYPGWPRYPNQAPQVVQYIQGSVVIDVVKPGSRQLLWRGEGRAALSDDSGENVRQLMKAAEAIVAKFPEATRRTVATRQ
jgi:hypothetical protein